jgi:hypothetical protein
MKSGQSLQVVMDLDYMDLRLPGNNGRVPYKKRQAAAGALTTRLKGKRDLLH